MKSYAKFMKPRGGAFFATICAAALFGAGAAKADPVDWTQYAKSFDIIFSGYTGSAPLTDFPVLIRLSAARNNFDYSKCQANGADLRFSDSDGNLIPHEIDTWNTAGESLVWVKVPSLTSSAKISAHYGYTGEGSLPAVTASDVWDSDYVGVWHLGQSAAPMNDSTSGGANLTAQNAENLEFESAGVVGNAVQFGLNDSVSGRLRTTQSSCRLQGQSEFTIECWSYQDAYDVGTMEREVVLLEEVNDSPWCIAYRLYEPKSSSNSKGRSVLQFNGYTTYFAQNVNKPQRAVWNHQAWSYNGTNGGAFYMNGQLDSTLSAKGDVPESNTTGTFYIGNQHNSDMAYPGKIDEVRISKIVRSADWVSATYATVMNDGFAEYDLSADNDWTQYEHRFQVSFPGYLDQTALTDFPVLVRISEDSLFGFSYADCKKPGGGDLRFADEDGNLLACEVDTWNPNGESLVWVKVPRLTPSTKLFGYYGWASAPPISAAAVWSNGFVGVWHLGESALPMKESSKTSSDFTISSGSGIGFAAEGIVGGSVDFGASGNTRALSAADNDALDGFTQCTIEAWTYVAAENRPTGNDKSTGLLVKRASYNSQISYFLYNSSASTDEKTVFSISTNGTAAIQVSESVHYEDFAWTYQALLFNGDEGKIGAWKDGVSVQNTTTSHKVLYGGSANLYLGNFNVTDSRNFPGKVDEVRISNVARSSSWIKATHDTIAYPDFAECDMVAENDWTKYSHKFSVTFKGYEGQTTLTDFPVLVKLSESSPAGFSYADCKKPNGKDLRFADDDGNLLSSEVDTWNTSGVSLVWVKVPFLTSSTKITGYYGWALAPQIKAADVWDENYVGVWHLGAAGNATQKDSTTNRHNFVCSSVHLENVNLAVGEGAVGGAVGFNVTDDKKGRLTAADPNGRLSGFMDCTIEAWLYPTNNDSVNGRVIFSKRKNYNNMAYQIYADKTDNCFPRFILGRQANSGTADYPSACTQKPELNAWSHLAFTRLGSSGLIAAYLNKEKVTPDNAGTSASGQILSNPDYPLVLGNGEQADSTSAYPGNIDEVRISNIVRSEDWLKATYDTVMNADFATYGEARKQVKGLMIIVR